MSGMGKETAQKSIINMIIFQMIGICHIVNMMLVALQLSKEAKCLVAGNSLSFNNHLLQETLKEIQGNDLGYGNIVKDWTIRRPTICVH
jgi:hypothetical protein